MKKNKVHAVGRFPADLTLHDAVAQESIGRHTGKTANLERFIQAFQQKGIFLVKSNVADLPLKSLSASTYPVQTALMAS